MYLRATSQLQLISQCVIICMSIAYICMEKTKGLFLPWNTLMTMWGIIASGRSSPPLAELKPSCSGSWQCACPLWPHALCLHPCYVNSSKISLHKKHNPQRKLETIFESFPPSLVAAGQLWGYAKPRLWKDVCGVADGEMWVRKVWIQLRRGERRPGWPKVKDVYVLKTSLSPQRSALLQFIVNNCVWETVQYISSCLQNRTII